MEAEVQVAENGKKEKENKVRLMRGGGLADLPLPRGMLIRVQGQMGRRPVGSLRSAHPWSLLHSRRGKALIDFLDGR